MSINPSSLNGGLSLVPKNKPMLAYHSRMQKSGTRSKIQIQILVGKHGKVQGKCNMLCLKLHETRAELFSKLDTVYM